MSRRVPQIKVTVTDKPHVVIRASAGSGKTYQLSNRYLDLLHHGVAPGRVLATTFTRKAAGEILDRVLRRLAEAASDPKIAAKIGEGLGVAGLNVARAAEILRDLCRSMHRLNISTIDSFFHRIASCFNHELGLPAQPVIVAAEDAAAVALRSEAIEAVLGDDDTQTLVTLLRRLHHDTAQRGITEAIDDIVKSLYDLYRQTVEEHWSTLIAPPTLNEVELAEAIAALDALTAGVTDKTMATALRNARDHILRGHWKAFLKSGLAPKILADPGAPIFKGKPVPAEFIRVFEPLIAHARGVLLSLVAAQTRATYDLLHRFDTHYTRLRLARRVLLFSDLPHKLAHELPLTQEDLLTEIHYRLDTAVTHLLLDEFQDTSSEQWAVLRPFAQEITRQCTDFRTFFCVGDVKQAIYGWRGGRAEIFDQIEADLSLPESARISMNVSFRSSQIVLDAVGMVFTNLSENPGWKDEYGEREQALKWSARFERHLAEYELPGYVELVSSKAAEKESPDAAPGEGGEDDDESLPSKRHAAFVARRIGDIVAQAPGRSLGVLVSTKKVIPPIVFELRRLDVEVSVEGAGSLTGDPAVEVILAALTLADHPGHTAAAFHVVNSPLGEVVGLTTIERPARIAAAQRIRRDILSEGVAALVARWARDLAPSCDERSGEALTRLIELAVSFQSGPAGDSLRTHDFIDYIKATRVETPASTAVRVMTVHGAKGLEFDIVVLPELGKKAGEVHNGATCVDRDEATYAIRAVHRASNEQTRDLSPQLEEAYRQERARRLRDDLCGLYVAMTRAKHALHMIVEPVKLTKGGPSVKGVRDQSYAALLRGALTDSGATESPAGGETLYQSGDAAWCGRAADDAPKTERTTAAARPWHIELAASRASSRRTWRLVSPSSLHQGSRVNVADLLNLGGDEGRRTGTLMHAWCEAIDWLGSPADAPSDEALAAIAAECCGAALDEAWLKTRIARFRAALALPGMCAAFARPATAHGESLALWRERSFTIRRGADLLRGQFDRVVVFETNGRPTRAELIDFKSDSVSRDESNIPTIISNYRPQIEAYRDALAAMLSLPRASVKASLLLLACGKQVEVT